jgi:predicted dehydrogenase
MRATGRYDIVAIVDRQPDRARRVALELDVPLAIEGVGMRDLDGGEAIDVVTCGTAPFTHFDVVATALAADKHAITDKPFALSVREGEDLAELARSRCRQLAVVHNFQFARSVRRVDDWYRRGRLGELEAVWALQLSNPARRLPTWIDDLPLGLFYDESPHLLYLIRHFAGPNLELASASVVPSRRGSKTPAQLTAQYRAPLPVTLTMNFEAPLSEWQLLLLGSRGAAAIDIFRDIAVFVPADDAHRTLEVARTSVRAALGHLWGYVRSGPSHLRGALRYGNEEVFRRFADAVEHGHPLRGISAADAVAVLRAQHELICCATGKGW